MEKFGQILEIIIKTIFAAFSIVAVVFLVKNVIFMLMFFKLDGTNEAMFYNVFSNTFIGKVYNTMGAVIDINAMIILRGIVSYFLNLEVICCIFIMLIINLLVLYFIFIKWALLKTYLKMSGIVIASYIFKHAFILLFLAIFNDYSLENVCLALKVGSIFYLLLSIIEFIIFMLWIIKFMVNIVFDIKYLRNHC